MIKAIKTLCLAAFACVIFSFTAQNTGGLKGQVLPAEGVAQILLISGTDSLQVPAQNGSFKLNQLKARTYQLLIKTNPPYQEYRVSELAVIDSAITDMGQIKLLK